MTGGLMQLVACGAQDIFLTGSPMISYFKTVYRRHTNFAIETIKQTFDVPAGFGVTTSCTLSRNGDLITGACIQASLPDLTEKSASNFGISNNGVTNPGRRFTRWIDNIGHYLIKSVEISIGGNLIDRHYSDWLEIWAQLTVPAGQMEGYRKMIGQDPKNAFGQNTGLQADVLSSIASLGASPYSIKQSYIVGRDIFIPLQFWFCRNLGLALPLIALQYNDVRIQVSFREAEELIQVYVSDSTRPVGWVPASEYSTYVAHNSLTANLLVDYVFLDADERRRFAQVSHEYLVEQVQYQEDTCMSESRRNISLNFNHPVKELLWVLKGFESRREWSNFTNTQLPDTPPFQTIQISNNQLIPGLTGLPSETYISPSKLSISIIPSANTTALFTLSETDTLISTGGYVILNGDTITMNVDGDTQTNATITILDTTNRLFYTTDILINGQTYNTVVSVIRTAGTLQPDKVSINLRSSLNISAYRTITATTTGIFTFIVTPLNGFIMIPGDAIYVSSSTNASKKITLVVATVDGNGVATEFFLRADYSDKMDAGVIYDTVTSISRTGRYIPMTPLTMSLRTTTDVTPDGVIVQGGLNVSSFIFTPTYNMNVGDVIEVTPGGVTDIITYPPVSLTVNAVNIAGVPTSVTVKSETLLANVTYSQPTSIRIVDTRPDSDPSFFQRTFNTRLLMNLSTGTAIPKNTELSNSSFSFAPNVAYEMRVGDIIKVLPKDTSYSLSAVGIVRVTEVNNGLATKIVSLTALSPNIVYSNVISIDTYDTDFQTQQLVLNQSGLSDIKTYDDLMRFSNYDSVRPYGSNGLAGNPISKTIVTMNTSDRFAERPGTYFSLVQPRNHHTNIPVSPGINVYSFALNPEEHQPSGTCNFSRIEEATLRIQTGPVYTTTGIKPDVPLTVKMFAVNYNILRIFNGMGGLAYNS